MGKSKTISLERVKKVALELDDISISLNGLGSLFLYQGQESCLEPHEYAGIGYLLQRISKELAQLEDDLSADS